MKPAIGNIFTTARNRRNNALLDFIGCRVEDPAPDFFSCETAATVKSESQVTTQGKA